MSARQPLASTPGASHRLLRRLLAGLAAAVLLLAAFWRLSLPPRPDRFYDPPAGAIASPGTLLRAAPFVRDVPARARGWRILYATRRADGAPAVASAIVLVPLAPSLRPRPVIAWAHGTTGVEAGCAPSLLAHPFPDVPALGAVIGRGWALVATDYPGLGTRGMGREPVHPYLVGADEAHSALDAVRAARHLPGSGLSDQVVVWGHSQGGHTALWTGILAETYAPDLALAGVAALAPASDLPELTERVQSTLAGRITTSYLVTAYSGVFSDVQFDQVVRGPARLLARDIARRCLGGMRALTSVAEAHMLGGPIFREDPRTGAFGERLRENTPTAHIAAPLLIAQGLKDPLVLPEVQAAYVGRQCRAGQPLTYLTYPDRDHLSLVAADSPLIAVLLGWSEERFRGVPARDRCPGRGL